MLLIAFTFVSAKVDAILINGGNYIDDHRPRYIFREVSIAIISLFNWYYFLSLGMIFTALFDPLLNHYRNLDFWYLGTEADWDLFFKKHLLLYKILRFTALTAGLIMYFYG